MEELIKRNNKANILRKQITETTTSKEIYSKLIEEVKEACMEYLENGETEHLSHELSDIVSVCFNWQIRMGLDPIKEFEKITIKNETRED